MQVLLLQKPTKTSKAEDHMQCRENRLERWKKGDIANLLAKGRCIQAHLPSGGATKSITRVDLACVQ